MKPVEAANKEVAKALLNDLEDIQWTAIRDAFLLHHVLADQWVVVIILLVFSMKENMFVEHTENMMMVIFCEFHAVA